MTIAKGRLRSGPEQLAAYVQKTDNGQRATLLDPSFEGEDLHNTFLLFDAVGNGRTEKTLYHGQICPRAEDGEKMTDADWLRAVEIYAENLGMADHPRRVILHEGGTDNPHIHVVIQRYDQENDKLWHPSFNYVKHERASLEIALEFGHEIVPGKHVKRNRKKQPEFPRGETNQALEQQAARTAMTVEERKEEITDLRKASDSAQAFKNALEEAGYILAKGDKRGFVLVDAAGEVYSLSKHVTDIKGKEFKAFMAGVDLEALPTAEQAKAAQEDRPLKAEKQAPQASKFLTPEATLPVVQPPPAQENQPQPQPADLTDYAPKQPPSKFLQPEVAAKVETPKPDAAPTLEPVKSTPDAPTEPAPVLAPPAQPIEKRRAPLPSDPWMAQTGGVNNLSPAHLESAQNSYEKWANKGSYDFANYVAYVQRQWESKELPPPPSPTEAPADAPAAPQPPAEPGKKKGYDYGAYSPKGPVRGPVTVPAPTAPAPPQPKAPDLEGPRPTWIKERGPHVPITPKQPGVNFDTYAPKAPEPPPAAPDLRDQKLKEEFQTPAAPPPPKPEPTIDPEIEIIRKRIFARQQAENRKFTQLYAAEERDKIQAIERAAQNITAANVDKMEVFDFQQRHALQAEQERHAPRKGVKEALRKFFKPEDEEAKAAERQEEMDLFRSQQAHDRRAYIKSLEESRDKTLNGMRDQLKALRDEHQVEQRERNKGYDDELARRLRERQKAIDLARKQSEWDKDFEKEQEQRWDDPDVPRRGK